MKSRSSSSSSEGLWVDSPAPLAARQSFLQQDTESQIAPGEQVEPCIAASVISGWMCVWMGGCDVKWSVVKPFELSKVWRSAIEIKAQVDILLFRLVTKYQSLKYQNLECKQSKRQQKTKKWVNIKDQEGMNSSAEHVLHSGLLHQPQSKLRALAFFLCCPVSNQAETL